MSELAEGARLEIACTTKSGTEGSNPSLSAIFISPNPDKPKFSVQGLQNLNLGTRQRWAEKQ